MLEKLKKQDNMYKIIGIVFIMAFLIIETFVVLDTFGAIFQKSKFDYKIEAIEVEHYCAYDYRGKGDCNYIYYYIDGKQKYCSNKYSTHGKYNDSKTIYYNQTDCLVDQDLNYGVIDYLKVIIPIFIFIPGILLIKISKKDIDDENSLEKVGILYKDLPYKMIKTKTIKDKTYRCIQVEYVNKKGKHLKLKSKLLYKEEPIEDNGLADLLIDPNDEKKYFIDFDIELDKKA